MWKRINLFPEITRKRTFNKNTLQRLGKALISLFGERVACENKPGRRNKEFVSNILHVERLWKVKERSPKNRDKTCRRA